MTTELSGESGEAAAGRAGATRRVSLGLLVLVFVGFISLGLPDGLLGVSWPSIRRDLGLPLDALGALLIAATTGYIIASLTSGWIVERIGIGLLLALSSLLTAFGLLGYALAPSWPMMVALGLVAGLGGGTIDAGLNAYVALHHSSRLLNWLHACFGIGAAAGPAIMTTVLQAGQSWRLGYAIVAGGQLALGTCFLLTLKQWQSGPTLTPALSQREREQTQPLTPALSQGERESGMLVVGLSVVLFFLYTGIETAAGQWAYSLFVEGRKVLPQAASLWVSIYWGALAIGRVLSGLVSNRLGPVLLVRSAAIGLLAGAILLWLDLGQSSSFVGLGLMGLSAATVFPTLIAATPARVGQRRASRVIGFEVGAASLGIGGIPALAGVLAARVGFEAIPLLLVVATAALLVLHEGVVRVATRRSADT